MHIATLLLSEPLKWTGKQFFYKNFVLDMCKTDQNKAVLALEHICWKDIPLHTNYYIAVRLTIGGQAIDVASVST